MHEPVTIEIGGKVRTLLFTPKALRIAQKLLGGDDPRQALATRRGPDVVAGCAAAGLIHEMKEKASPDRIDAWIANEPHKYKELEAAVVEAVVRAYRKIGILDDEEVPPGGAGGPASSPKTSGA